MGTLTDDRIRLPSTYANYTNDTYRKIYYFD